MNASIHNRPELEPDFGSDIARTKWRTVVAKAINNCGGTEALAARVGVGRRTVERWLDPGALCANANTRRHVESLAGGGEVAFVITCQHCGATADIKMIHR